MRIKRVLAPDIQTALERVRAELGPDAVIIATRPLGETPEERRRGLTGVELVAGVDDQAPISAVAQARQVARGAGDVTVAPAAARAAYTLAMAAGQAPMTPPADRSSSDRAGRNGSRKRLPGVPLTGVRSAGSAGVVSRPTFPHLSRAGTFADELERLIPAREALAARRRAAEGSAEPRAALLDLIRVKHEEFVAAPGCAAVPSYVPDPAAPAPPPPAPTHTAAAPASPAHAAAARTFERLCAAGLGERVAEEAVTAAIRAASRTALTDPDRLVELALACLARAVPAGPPLEATALAGRALVFTGPAGVGKTTALLKTALHLRRAGAEVVMAGADVSRLGAVEQLQRYGALLRLPVRPVYEPDDLAALLAAATPGQITLVDTPACGPGTEEECAEVVALIRAAATPLVVLTVAAGTGEGDLRRLAATAQALTATSVAVTRLDETEAPAAPLHVPAALRLPVLLCSAGRDVTTGLRTPTPAELAADALAHLRPVAHAA